MFNKTIFMDKRKIIISAHLPEFKYGAIVEIRDMKNELQKGTQRLTFAEIKKYAGRLRAEMYFGSLENLDKFIDVLILLRQKWEEAIKE